LIEKRDQEKRLHLKHLFNQHMEMAELTTTGRFCLKWELVPGNRTVRPAAHSTGQLAH